MLFSDSYLLPLLSPVPVVCGSVSGTPRQGRFVFDSLTVVARSSQGAELRPQRQ